MCVKNEETNSSQKQGNRRKVKHKNLVIAMRE
jgi:hypothetical protein